MKWLNSTNNVIFVCGCRVLDPSLVLIPSTNESVLVRELCVGPLLFTLAAAPDNNLLLTGAMLTKRTKSQQEPHVTCTLIAQPEGPRPLCRKSKRLSVGSYIYQRLHQRGTHCTTILTTSQPLQGMDKVLGGVDGSRRVLQSSRPKLVRKCSNSNGGPRHHPCKLSDLANFPFF